MLLAVAEVGRKKGRHRGIGADVAQADHVGTALAPDQAECRWQPGARAKARRHEHVAILRQWLGQPAQDLDRPMAL